MIFVFLGLRTKFRMHFSRRAEIFLRAVIFLRVNMAENFFFLLVDSCCQDNFFIVRELFQPEPILGVYLYFVISFETIHRNAF